MKINPMYVAVAAGAYFVIKNLDSNGTTKPAATTPAATPPAATKTVNPAFTYPKTKTFSRDDEFEILNKLLAQANITGSGTVDGNPLTPEQFEQGMMLLDEAIAYYPNRPEQSFEQVKSALLTNKDNILAAYNKAENVGMGPISGFSGVY